MSLGWLISNLIRVLKKKIENISQIPNPLTLFVRSYCHFIRVFRMLPGTPWVCPGGRNDYDPRVRPWYVAASSGPKDVVLILDTSGSMENAGRMVSESKDDGG